MKQFFSNIIDRLISLFMIALLFTPVILLGSFIKSCSPEEQAIARAEAEAERQAEQEAFLDEVGSIYRRVYDEANEAYWDLASMYEDLYDAYLNDPGRTGSLDSFINPIDLEGPLPDDVDCFLDN